MILRIILLLGLVSHKLLWEIMKTGDQRHSNMTTPSPGILKRLVKYGKALTLAFLIYQTLFLQVLPIAKRAGPLRVIGVAIYFAGLASAIAGRLQLGKNWANLEDYQVTDRQSLVTNGIYRHVRHPIYGGDLLLLMGLQLALNSWLVLATLIPLAVVFKQASTEEALLLRKFAGYSVYRARTKRFIPFLI